MKFTAEITGFITQEIPKSFPHAVYKQSAWELKIFQLSPDLLHQSLPHSRHIFSSINSITLKLIPLNVMALQSFLHFHENVFSSCCYMYVANGYQFFCDLKVQIPQMITRSCNVLKRSIYSSSAREYHKEFLVLQICEKSMLFPSSSVLHTTELAERLILTNKLAFFLSYTLWWSCY